ncbi:MAG: WD40 repeat domain-containing protein [Candidatus Acidiferrum sp.]
MSLSAMLFQRFRRFPFWSQAVITLGSVGILVVLWSACGLPPPPPRPAPPPLSAPRLELSGNFGAVFSLAFSPTSQWLAAGTGDKQIHVFDVSSNEMIRTLSGHLQIVKGLAFSPDGKILASASLDKTIKLWDTSTGNEIRTLSGHFGGATGVAFSPDGLTIASASWDTTVILWDVHSGNQLQKLSGHTDKVNAVAFSPDGRLLVSASDDGSVRLWDPQTGKLVRSLPDVNARVESVAFSPDGKFLASGASRNHLSKTSHYGGIRVWDLEAMGAVSAFEKYRSNIHMLAFKPDGTVLAVAEWPLDVRGNSFVTFWDVKNQVVLNRFDVDRFGDLYAIAYSHDGRWLASGGRTGRIRLW